MKVNEIINEELGFGDGFGDNYASDIEKGRMRDEMNADFENDRTPLSEFDLAEIKRMVMPAARNKPQVKRQVEDMLSTWEQLLDDDAYIEDDLFNKVYKQYEQLKDSQESALIKFNKMHAITKEVKDGAAGFDSFEGGEDGDKWKDDNGHFGK